MTTTETTPTPDAAPTPTSAPPAPPPSEAAATVPTPPAAAEPHPHAPPPPPPVTEAPPRPARPLVPLVFNPSNGDELWRWAIWGAKTDFVAPICRGNPDNVMWLLMMGKRWGLDIISSLSIFVIEGKPSLPAAHMVGIVQAYKYCDYFKPTLSTMDMAEWETVRLSKGDAPPQLTKLDYTREEAQLMGFFDKGSTPEKAKRNQWNTQPRVMLRWRSATALGRLAYADLLAGLYSTEEMTDVVEVGGGEVRTVEVPKDVIMNAARRDGAVINDLRALPDNTVGAPPDMEAAFRNAGDVTLTNGGPVPEPVRRPSTTASRVSDKARRTTEPTVEELFPQFKCTDCGVPIVKRGKCDPCARS